MMMIKKTIVQRQVILLCLGYVLLSAIMATSAINYHIYEDFSKGGRLNWSFKGIDFGPASQNPEEVQSKIKIENGEMVFAGSEDSGILDTAEIRDNTSFGVWSFDVYQPENTIEQSQTNRIWGILLSATPMGIGNNETNYPNMEVDVRGDTIAMSIYNETTTKKGGASKSIKELQKFNQYQHFDIIRAETRLYIYIEDKIVENYTLDANLAINNHYLTLAAAQGSGIKIDNLKISTEYNQRLLELKTPQQYAYDILMENSVWFVTVAILFSVGLIGFWSYKFAVSRRNRNLFPKMNGKNDILSNLFENNTQYYLSLLAQKELQEELNLDSSETNSKMIQDLQHYKPVLHPVRLTLMKLLTESSRLKSSELKGNLGISWSEFSNAIGKLHQMLYVEIKDSFDKNGTKCQVVEITQLGIQEYTHLIEVISVFVSQTNLHLSNIDDQNLYPHQ